MTQTSGPSGPSGPIGPSGPRGPRTARSVWRAARTPLLITALVLAVGVGTALLSARPPATLADPGSPSPEGSLALARLLGEQGVHVDRTADLTEAARATAGSTLLVVGTDRLTPQQARRLAGSGADLVLLTPPAAVLDAVEPRLTLLGERPEGEVRDPGCALGVARRAGPAAVSGASYGATGPAPVGVTACYAAGDAAHGAGLVVLTEVARAVTVLGDPTPLTNQHLAEEGNAALTMGLLGQHDRLVWVVPPLLPPTAGRGQASIGDLVGDPVRFGLVQLAVAVVLLAGWRARQLGRPVVEPLPVVVRASETTQGRGRLYRRAGARQAAAQALRTATVHHLAVALGLPLPAAADPGTVAVAAAAVAGRPTAEVATLLGAGQHSLLDHPGHPGHPIPLGEPADDAALIALADALDRLEQEVRHGEHSHP